MMSRRLFELTNTVLQDLRDPSVFDLEKPSQKLFGGLNIVMAGDFRQLLPVVRNAVPATPEVDLSLPSCDTKRISNPSDLLNHLLWAAEEWKSVRVLRLTEQIRQSEDIAFASLLRAVGRGCYSKHDSPLNLNSTTDVFKAYEFVFPWIKSGCVDDVRGDQMLVCPLNSQVDKHQEKLMEMFPGKFLPPFVASCEITKVRSGETVDGLGEATSYILPEMTYHVCPTGVAPHKLFLKRGAPLMIVRTVLFPHLVNGTIVILESCTSRWLRVRELKSQKAFFIPRIDFEFSYSEMSVRRRQFPVRPAFAVTVHKSQGETLSKVVIDLRSEFFAAGQLYVALSRTKRAQDVLLLRSKCKEERSSQEITKMSQPTRNPILKQAVQFAESEGTEPATKTSFRAPSNRFFPALEQNTIKAKRS